MLVVEAHVIYSETVFLFFLLFFFSLYLFSFSSLYSKAECTSFLVNI